MNCPKCGGTMSPNPRKLPTNKQPDFLCNQDKGACGSTTTKDGKTYNNVTGAWKPKEGGFQQYAVRPGTPMVKAPDGQDGFVPKPQSQDEMWKKKGEQMNRSNLAAQVLQGKPLDWKMLTELEAWVLTGKTPAELSGGIDINNVPF